MHVQNDVLRTARRCNNFVFGSIHLKTVSMLNTALF